MGLIKEPLEVDFFVDSKPLTKNDIKLISEYIAADKAKRKKTGYTRKKAVDAKQST
ncbi:MAG: hypothetical protein ACM3P1_06695 [Candidatus Saccharibacteria bacterium]